MTTNTGLQTVDPAAIAKAEEVKARIQAAYIVAMNRPRDVDQARVKILKACERPMFAEKVVYRKPVGSGKFVEGPSVRFIEHALREWCNVLTDSQVLYEDDTTIRVKAYVTDLETNTSHAKEFNIQKTVERKSLKPGQEAISQRENSNGDITYLVLATEQEIQNKIAAQVSKAIRNEGGRLIPADIVDEAMIQAKKTLKDEHAKDPESAKKRMTDSFAKINVFPKQLADYLGHSLDTISPAERNELLGIYQAIESGEASWNEYVQKKTDEADYDKKPKVKNQDTPITQEQIQQVLDRCGSEDVANSVRAMVGGELSDITQGQLQNVFGYIDELKAGENAQSKPDPKQEAQPVIPDLKIKLPEGAIAGATMICHLEKKEELRVVEALRQFAKAHGMPSTKITLLLNEMKVSPVHLESLTIPQVDDFMALVLKKEMEGKK